MSEVEDPSLQAWIEEQEREYLEYLESQRRLTEAKPVVEDTSAPKFENHLPDDHFLSQYLRYGYDVSDTYTEYWYVGGLYILAEVSDKMLKVDLRQMTIYPNLYVMVLGKSTTSRKSTALGKTRDIWRVAKPDVRTTGVPTDATPEAFTGHMNDYQHTGWIRDEASGLLDLMAKQYMRGFKDLLMALYDNEPYSKKLRTGQRIASEAQINIQDPFLNIMWATTYAGFTAKMSIDDTLTGFAARFLYAAPQGTKDRWLPLEQGEGLDSEIGPVMIEHLQGIVDRIGEMDVSVHMDLSKESQEYYNRWQEGKEQAYENGDDDSLSQIYGRLAPTVVKLAILFELGSSDFDPERPIRLEYIREACRQVDEYFMPSAVYVYGLIRKSNDRDVMSKIVDFLKSKGGKATRREVSLYVKAKDLNAYLDMMVENDIIEFQEVKGEGRGRKAKMVILK